MNLKNKYLKYKNKYLKLKKNLVNGGENEYIIYDLINNKIKNIENNINIDFNYLYDLSKSIINDINIDNYLQDNSNNNINIGDIITSSICNINNSAGKITNYLGDKGHSEMIINIYKEDEINYIETVAYGGLLMKQKYKIIDNKNNTSKNLCISNEEYIFYKNMYIILDNNKININLNILNSINKLNIYYSFKNDFDEDIKKKIYIIINNIYLEDIYIFYYKYYKIFYNDYYKKMIDEYKKYVKKSNYIENNIKKILNINCENKEEISNLLNKLFNDELGDDIIIEKFNKIKNEKDKFKDLILKNDIIDDIKNKISNKLIINVLPTNKMVGVITLIINLLFLKNNNNINNNTIYNIIQTEYLSNYFQNCIVKSYNEDNIKLNNKFINIINNNNNEKLKLFCSQYNGHIYQIATRIYIKYIKEKIEEKKINDDKKKLLDIYLDKFLKDEKITLYNGHNCFPFSFNFVNSKEIKVEKVDKIILY